MSVDDFIPTPVYTISGIGPYAITHPYEETAIKPSVLVASAFVQLLSTDYSISPSGSDTLGDLFLSPAAAATYAGMMLFIDRITPDQQGWIGVLGEREKGLEAQLDRMVQANQELRLQILGAIRIRGNLSVLDWLDGTVPIRSGSAVVSGPTLGEIVIAATKAAEAAASALAAAASAQVALDKENSMLRGRGQWVTATAYAPSDLSYQLGSQYECIEAHTSGVFATDLAANKWRLFAAQPAAGAGTGDMLKSELLSGLSNYPQARANMGLGALATLGLLPFSGFDPATIISDVEGLAANKVANAVPVAKAVTDYVDGRPGPVWLATKTASDSVALNFTEFNNAVYRRYLFHFEGVLPVVSGVALRMRFSTNGGASYGSGGSAYRWSYWGSTSDGGAFNGNSNGDNALTVCPNISIDTVDFGVFGNLMLMGGLGATRGLIMTELVYETAANLTAQIRGGGTQLTTQDTDAVSFFANSGNLLTGEIRMFGIE